MLCTIYPKIPHSSNNQILHTMACMKGWLTSLLTLIVKVEYNSVYLISLCTLYSLILKLAVHVSWHFNYKSWFCFLHLYNQVHTVLYVKWYAASIYFRKNSNHKILYTLSKNVRHYFLNFWMHFKGKNQSKYFSFPTKDNQIHR